MPEGQNVDEFETLLEVLRCPVTLSPLRREGDVLVAEVGGLRYPIRDGIPQMIADEAELPDGVASLDELREQLRSQGVTAR
ncbi:MAG: Trm112 family protein [Planctomycetota bacterium]